MIWFYQRQAFHINNTIYMENNQFMPIGFVGLLAARWNLRIPSPLLEFTGTVQRKTEAKNRVILVAWMELFQTAIRTEMKASSANNYIPV